MKTKKQYGMVLLGIACVILGITLSKQLEHPEQFFLAFPYVCIGIGCGMFGHGMGAIITARSFQHHPDLQKEMEIHQRDERNLMIAHHAKAKAFDFMTYVFSALMLAFAFMGVDMIPLLLLVFAYLLVEGYAIYYRIRYDKEC